MATPVGISARSIGANVSFALEIRTQVHTGGPLCHVDRQRDFLRSLGALALSEFVSLPPATRLRDLNGRINHPGLDFYLDVVFKVTQQR